MKLDKKDLKPLHGARKNIKKSEKALSGLRVVSPTSVARWVTSPSAACGRGSKGAVGAAVDKIEEKRKPEDFIGHRKRGDTQNDFRLCLSQRRKVLPPQPDRVVVTDFVTTTFLL